MRQPILAAVGVLLALMASAWADVGPPPRLAPFLPPAYQGLERGGAVHRDRASRGAYRLPPRRAVYCDVYGRCWGSAPDRFHRGDRYRSRPPGWADSLPRRSKRPDRFARPGESVVCDRLTSICYKQGRIDKSETETYFGSRAGDRADELRDRRGRSKLFVPERGIVCDRSERTCFDDGIADYSLTRRYFGRRAAERVD